MKINNKLILVTGASGYIGEHLLLALEKEGAKIRTFDKRESTIVKNEFIQGDITDLNAIKSAAKDCDAIVHLACIPRGKDNPKNYFLVNSLGTLNALEAARLNKIKKFVYTSTAFVYGTPVKLPITEDHPTATTNDYALTKLIGENYCVYYSKHYNLNTVILRVFNVYGPSIIKRERDTVENLFINAIKEGRQPVIIGIENKKDFVYIDDVINAIILSLKKEKANKKIINIASGVSISLDDLASIINEILKKNIKPIHKEGINSVLQADISLAKKILKYKPKVSIEEGLKKLVESYTE